MESGWIGPLDHVEQLDSAAFSSGQGSFAQGGSIINNGGTATISAGNNATDTTGYGTILIGGSGFLGGSGLSGYVNMTGGTLSSSVPLQEALGIASGSGIFTQSGGTNNAQTNDRTGQIGNFSSLQLGWSNGGYGEYDLQGGALNPDAIWVGGNFQPIETSPT